MTNEFAIEILKQLKEKPTLVNDIDTVEEASWLDGALDLAIEALEKSKRYKSVWLQEHDAEPFCYKSILDTKTNEVYVCKGDTEHFKQYGMTIEKREEDEK